MAEKTKMDKVYIGSHVSMKGPSYYVGSITETIENGATTLMLYTGAPQNFARTPLNMLRIDEALSLAELNNLDITKFVCHAPYLINLANTINSNILNGSIDLLISELERTDAMKIKTLVLHPGSHVGAGAEIGLISIIESLNKVLDIDKTNVTIALETMPQSGNQVGGSLEEIAYIINNINKPDRLAVCLDTCHLFSAGVDVRDVDFVVDLIEKTVGLDKISCIHLNDTQNDFKSKKDRHANLGKGILGFKTLYAWIHHPDFDGVPFILETPFVNGKSPHKREIEMLLTGDYDSEWDLKL